MLDESGIDDLNNYIETQLEELNILGLDLKLDLSEITDVNWYEVAWANEARRLMEKDD